MISNNILSQNLNDAVTLQQFFAAFGYGPNDTIWLRRFHDRDKTQPPCNMQMTPRALDESKRSILALNQGGYGIFFTVNPGGTKKAQIIKVVAHFMEIDPDEDELQQVEAGTVTMDTLLQKQIAKLQQFPLEPSIIVRTWKSLHVYWLVLEGQIERFEGIQRQLIQLFGSDPSIKDASRVMRVPGFYHMKHDPVLVKLIKFDPELVYTQDQLQQVLPPVKPKDSGADQLTKQQVQQTLDELGELVERDQSVRYVLRFLAAHDINVLGQKETPERSIMLAVRCPWEAEHTTPAGLWDSVIIIFRSGIIRYDCKHAHCEGRTWTQYKAFYDPDGQRIDEGYAAHKEAQGAADPDADETETRTLAAIFGEGAVVNVNADLHEPVPEKQWIVEGLCTKGECAIVSGSSKSGKSYLMTNLAITIASGGLWLGRFPCTKSRVLYLNGENQIDDARARFHAVFNAMGADPDQCEQITMICADGAMRTIQSLKKCLIAEITDHNYGVVLLDPMYCFYKGSEIDEADAKGFVSCIKDVCRETGAVVFCVHHHSKGAAMYKNASSRASGSGMLQRAFSTLLDISEVNDKDTELPEGQRGYEFTGQPRQAAGFQINLIFDFPLWRADTQGLLPGNARNRGQTAAARANNKNIAKAADIRRAMPDILKRAFKAHAKHDAEGDYVTVGDVVLEFEDLGVSISERSIERKLDDGVDGYMRDPKPGQRRYVRKAEFVPAAESIVPDVWLPEAPDNEP